MREKDQKNDFRKKINRFIAVSLFLILIFNSMPNSPAEYNDSQTTDVDNVKGEATAPSLLVHMKASVFDPLIFEPEFPPHLTYDSTPGYYLVQCTGPISYFWIERFLEMEIIILGYIPDYTYLIKTNSKTLDVLSTFSFIRWTGTYHPAYKLHKGLLEKEGELELSIVTFTDRKDNLNIVYDQLIDLGGEITFFEQNDNILRVKIDASRIIDIIRIPQVEWLEEYTYPVALMNHIRVFTGAETLHSEGYNGSGIVGEVKDNGIDQSHPDFEGTLIGTDGNPTEGAHGTACFGIVFSSGANNGNAEGMIPGGEGIFCDWSVGRKQSITNLVTIWDGVFQSNSWHMSGQTDGTYNSNSRANDEAVFDNDVTMLYAAGNSNDGVYSSSISTDAAAKNIITVGAVTHYNDRDRTNDMWVNWGAGGTPSQGPASDGRIKPDLAGVFDSIYTTDSTVYTYDTGQNGYNHDSDYYGGFGGTSGATPIVAGASGQIYQMYKDNFFGNNPGGNLPHAATVKAILIADAYQYEFSQADRFQQGWGGVDVGNVYDIEKNHFIVDEDVNLQTGESINYSLAPRPGEPMKITLVWTDVPGTTSSSQHLINDLNLKVTDPLGTVYWGNSGLESSKWSSSGGTADTLNNVECVFIENPQSGNWTIGISAQNIAMDGNIGTVEFDQPFALVASNVLQEVHDLGVANLVVSDYVEPGVQTAVSATVFNNGLSDETNFVVNLTIDGLLEDNRIIPVLGSGNSTQVDFLWTPATGIFTVGVDVEIKAGEELTLNNWVSKIVVAEPDVSVSFLEVPKYSRAGEQVTINATVTNLAKVGLSGVSVQMLVNGTIEDTKTISSLPAESSSDLTFTWTPASDGWYGIEVYVPPQPDETLDSNNRLNSSILITSLDPILVFIVDSWGTDNPSEAPWDYINENWMEFGITPILIDYTTLDKADFSYDDITQTNADVLLISSSYAREYSDSEIDAISNYVLSGHGFISTGISFYTDVPNNNKLAYVFGMRDDITYDGGTTSSLDILDLAHPIFKNVPNPYSPGNQWASSPSDGTWSTGDLSDGTYIAKSSDEVSSIIAHKGVAYISPWLEYQSTADDMQLLYNALIWSKWERELHDISVTDMEVPRHIGLGEQVTVNATVTNVGLSDESGIVISFYVDGNYEDQITLSSLASDSSQLIQFTWEAETTEDIYTLRIESSALSGETVLENNYAETDVIVSDGTRKGKIALISDSTQLQAVTGILDELNRTYDILNNNVQNGHTDDILPLLDYQMVIFYNENRVIDTIEHRTLNDYIELGGFLLVTGFDSLGAPDDALMADLVRSTDVGDNMGKSSFSVADDQHPIMDGVFGSFSSGSSYNVGQTDHDYAEADISRGAQTVAELPDGYDKIISTELASGGKVVYWNGNRYCEDWLTVDIEDMFKNLIVWLVPIFDDIGIVSSDIPSLGYVGEVSDITVTIRNFGVNDSFNFNMQLEVTDGNEIFHSELKSEISLASKQSKDITWQWTPTLSYSYDAVINLIITKDEIPQNNMVSGVINVFYKFFDDDMEGGVNGWDSTSSAFTPLWHLTTTESYSPTTSWWCGMESSSQYTVLGEQYLVSPVIDLTEAATAYMTFYHKYAVDDNPLGGDWGRLEINSAGSGWASLDSYSTLSLDWSQVFLDLNSYIGDTILLRFHLSAGVVLSDNGWWVDDVIVFGIKYQWGLMFQLILIPTRQERRNMHITISL
jgi:subtilase family serine protease